MKLFAPALIFCGAAAFGQSPQVPHKMQFAGLTLTIRDDARRDIQKDVDALTQHPKYFNVKVERARSYFPTIEKIFAEEHLPEDFKFLALQESALVPDAVSSSNAVGFWQFKDFTARQMGLRVDEEVDERMNIASASRAAARYLKQSNHYFNNWVYALQAYQMGAGGVIRSIGDKDLGARHMEITPETYWYVRKFLAHKVAFEEAVEGKPAIELTHLTSAGGRTISEIAKETAIEEQKLIEFNKWLKAERIPTDKEYAVLIPSGAVSVEFGILAIASVNATPVSDIIEKSVVVEALRVNGVPVVRADKGEGIAALARRGNIAISAFLHYNEMTIDKPVQAGQLFFVHKKKKRAAKELYTVNAGEDLWSISQKFGVQQKFLVRFNGLNDNSKPVAGMTLYMSNHKPGNGGSPDSTEVAILNEADSFEWDQPVARNGPQQEVLLSPIEGEGKIVAQEQEIQSPQLKEMFGESNSLSSTHQVKSTDTLYSVARQYGVTIKELMEWNDKKDFSLSVGEKLKVRSR